MKYVRNDRRNSVTGRFKRKYHIEEEFLRKEYVENGRSCRSIADEVGCSELIVREAMRKYGIPNRGHEWRQGRGRNLVGERFGKLVVVGKSNQTKNRDCWDCVCDCGRDHSCTAHRLLRGLVAQCSWCSRNYIYCGKIPTFVWDSIVRCAAHRHIRFTISIEAASDLFDAQHGRCSISGVRICFAETVNGHRKRMESTASLDRIDPDLGYVIGNVQWVHKAVNLMKFTFSQKRFIRWCERITDFQRKRK